MHFSCQGQSLLGKLSFQSLIGQEFDLLYEVSSFFVFFSSDPYEAAAWPERGALFAPIKDEHIRTLVISRNELWWKRQKVETRSQRHDTKTRSQTQLESRVMSLARSATFVSSLSFNYIFVSLCPQKVVFLSHCLLFFLILISVTVRWRNVIACLCYSLSETCYK